MHNNKLYKRLLLITVAILFSKLGLLAQPTPSSVQFQVPAPPAVTQGSGTVVNGSNGNNRTYLVVANFPVGKVFTTDSNILVFNAPLTYSGTNYVVLTWTPVSGATGYDVVRLASGQTSFTGTCTSCLLIAAANQTSATFTDTGANIGNYSASSVPGITAQITLNNTAYTEPQLNLISSSITRFYANSSIDIDNSAANSTKPNKIVTALPATGTVGDEVYLTTSTAGNNLWLLTTAPSTWTQITGNGGITGTINAGTIGQCAYYAANGTTLSGQACGTGTGTVTSVTVAGTANQIAVAGTCTITTNGTCTISIPTNPTLPGNTTGTFIGNLTGNVTGNASGTAGTITGLLTSGNIPKADILEVSESCQDAGGTDAYACNLSPAITAYVTGTRYRFKANTANTGTASLNLNTVGPITIFKLAGAINTVLANNDIRSGQWVEVVYDGTNFQMETQLGNAAAGGSGCAPAGSINQVLTDSGAGTCTSNSGVTITGSGTTVNATGGYSSGATPPALTAGTGSAEAKGEGTAPSVCPASTVDCVYYDSTQHGPLANYNNAGYLPIPQNAASTTSGDVATQTSANGGTLGDAGFTAANVVRKDAANAFGVGGSIDLHSSTVADPFVTKTIAGGATSANGSIVYDLTNKNFHAGANNVDNFLPVIPVSGPPTNNNCVKWGVASNVITLADAGSACGSGSGGSAGANLFSTTNSTTVTATSPTTLIGTVTGSTTIPVNTFTAGQVLQFQASGFYSTPATPASLTIALSIGGTNRITTGAVVQIASVTNGVWRLICNVTTRTAGASGTQIANCIFEGTGSTLTPGEAPLFVNTTWTIDTTATQAIDLLATWSTATGSPTITSTNISSWIPGAPVTSVFTQTGAIGNLSGDVTTAGSSVTTLANTAVTPGSYTATNLTVDAKGRITAASNGSGSTVTDTFPFWPYGRCSYCAASATVTAANQSIIGAFALAATQTSGYVATQLTTGSGTACTGGTCGLIFQIRASDKTTVLCTTEVGTSGNGTTRKNVNQTAAAIALQWVSGTGVSGNVCTLPGGDYYLIMNSDSTAIQINSDGSSGTTPILNAITTNYGFVSSGGNGASTGNGASLAITAGAFTFTGGNSINPLDSIVFTN